MTIDVYSDTVQTQAQQATQRIDQLGRVCILSNQIVHPIDHQSDVCPREPITINGQLMDRPYDCQPDWTVHERYHFERARVRGTADSIIEHNANIIDAI